MWETISCFPFFFVFFLKEIIFIYDIFQKKIIIYKILKHINMAILKQIKFGNSTNRIAYTEVAIKDDSKKALSVVGTNTGLEDANPLYTIALAVDGKTVAIGDSGLETSLALKVKEAEGEGTSAKKARIALVDSKGATGYSELSSVNIEDIVGDGLVSDASYVPQTGKLTITWAGSGDDKTTEIDLGALLDIQDIVIADGSGNYLSFAAVSPAPGTDAGQAQIGVKLADVTYTSTSGSTEATLSVDATNGSLLDAEQTIGAVKNYVDDVLENASAELAVKAQGDAYVAASIDANDNKKVIVDSNVVDLTATAGTPGSYNTSTGAEETAPVAATLSGTANSLADGADIATKVKTYVDGAIAIEAARSDAKNKADIAALDVTDAAVAGQYVSSVSETDGKIAVIRANVSDAVLNGYEKGTKPASTAIAATDDVKGALAKLEHQIDDAKAAATTKVVEGTDAGNNMEIVNANNADGSVTYTVNLTDVASKAALDAEITARKAVDGQSGQTYAANASANYINNATSLNDADVKLDAALKTVSNNLAAIQYKVSGTTLEFFGINEKTDA